MTENQTVHIVEITKGGVSFPIWLCASCRAARKADGWQGKVKGAVEHPCDDCVRNVRAPDRVDFVPTSPGARRPTREECPPPRKIPPWPKPKRAVAAKRPPTTWSSDDEEGAAA